MNSTTVPVALLESPVLAYSILVILSTSFLLYLYGTWSFQFFKNLGIHGPKPSIFLGTLPTAMEQGIVKYDQGLYNTYTWQKVCGIYEGRLPVLMVIDINMIEKILISDFQSFPNRRSFGYSTSMLSKGLLGAQGKYWEHIHLILSEILTPDRNLKKVFSSLSSCTDRFANYVTIQAEKGNSFNAQSVFSAYSSDVTASVFFDINIDSISDPYNAYARNTREILQLAHSHPIFILYFFVPSIANIVMKFGYRLIPTRISHFFTCLIEQAFRRKTENSNKDVSNHFLQYMMRRRVESNNPLLMDSINSNGGKWSSKGLTMNEIVAQSVTFFIAAFDTTCLSLAIASWHLAKYPIVQNKVLEELDLITDQQELNFESVNDLTYLEMVISEVLRLYPPSVRNERKAARDVMIDGIFIPKDLLVTIPIIAIHRDPKFWPEPNEFDPERFTAEAKAKRNPLCYQPFGAGPRGCIGSKLAMIEMKYLLASILRKVKFVSCKETVDNIVIKKTASNVPESPIVLGVELRDW